MSELTDLELVAVSVTEEPVNPACVFGVTNPDKESNADE